MSASGMNSKRPSPPTGTPTIATKRLKGEETGQATPDGATHSSQAIDPDQLSDALQSAGVDLREEEILLSSTLHNEPFGLEVSGRPGAVYSGQYSAPIQTPFLDSGNLGASVRKTSAEMGIRYVLDKDNEIMSLLSLSCQEWLSDIITDAVVLSRHRRRSRNDIHSNIARALRDIAIKDKEDEENMAAQKLALGLTGDGAGEDKKQESEETQHRAANATALMMTSGKKKYSWMTGGASPAVSRTPVGRSRSENTVRYREAREDPGVVLRDLLGALEEKRYGVEKAIVKGYSKVRN